MRGEPEWNLSLNDLIMLKKLGFPATPMIGENGI